MCMKMSNEYNMQYTSFDFIGQVLAAKHTAVWLSTVHFLKILSWSVDFELSPYLTTKYATQHIFYSV